MNTAICPRVTEASGQKFPSPQPAVMCDAARASMNWKNGWEVGTSLKVAVAGDDGRR